jgi:hypothetical protein
METLRAEGYYLEGETEGDCGEILADCQWRQTLTPTDLDGLYDVTVAIEDSRRNKLVYELHTLLFEAPFSTSQTNASGSSSPRGREGRRR